MTCTCGHHEHAHAQDVGMCGSPHGCDCNKFRKAPAVHDGLAMSIDHARATQDAEWLAGSEADTAERNLARAYLATTPVLPGGEGPTPSVQEARERVKFAGYGMPDDILDALIAAVRAERDAEIRAMVEGMPTHVADDDRSLFVWYADLLALLSEREAT